MKIRLHGTEKELKEFKDLISRVTEVLNCSTPYKDRGESKYYRLYMDVAPKTLEVEKNENLMNEHFLTLTFENQIEVKKNEQ